MKYENLDNINLSRTLASFFNDLHNNRHPMIIYCIILNITILVRERSHRNSSLRVGEEGGGGRWMMTLVIFLKGNNSNIDDEGGEGVKRPFL